MKDPLSRAAGGLKTVETLSGMDTAAHRLHPTAKILVTLGFIIAVVSVENQQLGLLLPFFAYPLLLSVISEIPLVWVLKRALPGLFFVLFAGVSNILLDTAPGLSMGSVTLSRGTVACLSLCLKALLTTGGVALLCALTPMHTLLGGLRALHVPKILTTVCMLCFRYLSVLWAQAGRMSAAYRLRSGKEAIEMVHMGSFLGQLLLLSADRAERVYAAMCLRGFTGEYPQGCKQPFTVFSGLYTGLMLLAFLGLRMGGVFI